MRIARVTAGALPVPATETGFADPT
jgi:hypothetical protein